MTRGILIFAFNNEKINYFKQATWIANRVEKFLGLPTTIVTDENSACDTKHNIVLKEKVEANQRNFDISESDFRSSWYNANRFQAYELSPYDETIVIDSDYIVNSDRLNLLFDSPHNFLCHRYAYDLANKDSLRSYQTFGMLKFPHYWATVLFFRKSSFAKLIFDFLAMIRENYSFYSKLYKFEPAPFRNDYAVSIALSIAYGHRITSIPTIPWGLPTALTDIKVKQINENEFELEYEKFFMNKLRSMRSIVSNHDIHCMNKKSLEEIVNANS